VPLGSAPRWVSAWGSRAGASPRRRAPRFVLPPGKENTARQQPPESSLPPLLPHRARSGGACELIQPGCTIRAPPHPCAIWGASTGHPTVTWGSPGTTPSPAGPSATPTPRRASPSWGHRPVPQLGTSPGSPGSAPRRWLGQCHPRTGHWPPLGHRSPAARRKTLRRCSTGQLGGAVRSPLLFYPARWGEAGLRGGGRLPLAPREAPRSRPCVAGFQSRGDGRATAPSGFRAAWHKRGGHTRWDPQETRSGGNHARDFHGRFCRVPSPPPSLPPPHTEPSQQPTHDASPPLRGDRSKHAASPRATGGDERSSAGLGGLGG